MNMDRPEAADTAEPGRLAQDPMDYREEAKLWIALEAGLGTLSGVARVMGISHPEAEEKYASWKTAPVCPRCADRCLNFLCPECGQHSDMPWTCDACRAGAS